MKMLMSLAQMKMGVPGTEKVGKNWVKMDIDVDGQEWVVNLMMVLQNGKKRYIVILIFECPSTFLKIKYNIKWGSKSMILC